jgi:hypothetical protein
VIPWEQGHRVDGIKTLVVAVKAASRGYEKKSSLLFLLLLATN